MFELVQSYCVSTKDMTDKAYTSRDTCLKYSEILFFTIFEQEMPPHTHCGQCCFNSLQGTEISASYAAVLTFGQHDIKHIHDTVQKRALAMLRESCTAYCTECMCITWLHHGGTICESLVTHELILSETA